MLTQPGPIGKFPPSQGDVARREQRWTFLTNHTHVLLCIRQDAGVRLRDVAAAVGITERAVQRIVEDLVEAGYLVREKIGRRNHYAINPGLPLRHPLEQGVLAGRLLELINPEGLA